MNQIVVLNAGGQYCHLIARRIRELGVHAVVADINRPASELEGVRGIIISGGPASVTEPTSPKVDRGIYDLGIPVLGICYGHQLMAKDLGGRVSPGVTKEYGHSSLRHTESQLFLGLPARDLTVWMSHGDTVVAAPPGFSVIGETDDCHIAAMAEPQRRLFGLQFHPEVVHTEFGTEIYRNFVFDVCACSEDWDPARARRAGDGGDPGEGRRAQGVLPDQRRRGLDGGLLLLLPGARPGPRARPLRRHRLHARGRCRRDRPPRCARPAARRSTSPIAAATSSRGWVA